MKEYIFPVRVVACNRAIDTSNLLQKQPLQIGLAERMTTVFEAGDYIILDFGKEMCGGVRILTFHADMARVRLRFGESVTETCSDVGGSQNATNDHALRDFEIHLPRFSDMTFGNTGFRFLRIDFYGKASIKSIVAENNILRRRTVYRYAGKDARIREIFSVAKRTVDLCTSSGYIWDGVKRDRLVWIGDMHPEMLALTTLYGRMPEIEKSLDYVREQTPLPGWMNGFPMYSMWWIIILADYYEKTNCRAFIEGQLPYLEALVVQMGNQGGVNVDTGNNQGNNQGNTNPPKDDEENKDNPPVVNPPVEITPDSPKVNVDNLKEEEAKNNLNSVNVGFDRVSNVITITGDINDLQEYPSSDPTQGDGKWVPLEIVTGLSTIVGAKVDGVELTDKDRQEAISLGMADGSFVLWVNATENYDRDIVIEKDGISKTIKVKFDNTAQETPGGGDVVTPEGDEEDNTVTPQPPATEGEGKDDEEQTDPVIPPTPPTDEGNDDTDQGSDSEIIIPDESGSSTDGDDDIIVL